MVSRDLFVFFFALQSFGANAQTKTVLSGAEIYGRCYAQFTGKPVPLKSSVLTAIQSGRISALSACEALLQTAELAALNGRLLNEDETSRAVLKRFYDFHRSWFAAGVVEQIQDHSTENSRGTIDVYDTTEPALALTRAAFAQGVKYGWVLAGNPAGSKIYHRLQGAESGPGPRNMPIGNGLPPSAVQAIRNWILSM